MKKFEKDKELNETAHLAKVYQIISFERKLFKKILTIEFQKASIGQDKHQFSGGVHDTGDDEVQADEGRVLTRSQQLAHSILVELSNGADLPVRCVPGVFYQATVHDVFKENIKIEK
jgi:hypothetical protein